jgi:hypothetical protein
VNEPLIRLLIVAVVASVALLLASGVRRGLAVRRRAVTFPSLDAGVTLFVSKGCSSCERVMAALDDAGVEEVTLVDWDESPQVFLDLGIDRVPTLVHLDDQGSGWSVQGIPSADRLRKWLGDP